MSAPMNRRPPKMNTPPLNMIYRFLQTEARVQIWLFERPEIRLEGVIKGFDEFLNVVVDACEEVNRKKSTRKALGRILLKGENITLIRNLAVNKEDINMA